MTQQQQVSGWFCHGWMGRVLAVAAFIFGLAYGAVSSMAETARTVPPPAVDETALVAQTEVAVLSGWLLLGRSGGVSSM